MCTWEGLILVRSEGSAPRVVGVRHLRDRARYHYMDQISTIAHELLRRLVLARELDQPSHPPLAAQGLPGGKLPAAT